MPALSGLSTVVRPNSVISSTGWTVTNASDAADAVNDVIFIPDYGVTDQSGDTEYVVAPGTAGNLELGFEDALVPEGHYVGRAILHAFFGGGTPNDGVMTARDNVTELASVNLGVSGWVSLPVPMGTYDQASELTDLRVRIDPSDSIAVFVVGLVIEYAYKNPTRMVL